MESFVPAKSDKPQMRPHGLEGIFSLRSEVCGGTDEETLALRKLALKIKDHEEPKVCATASCAAGGAHDGPRIRGPLPALVKGSDARGLRFHSDTVLENLSAVDFQLRLAERVEAGERLFVVTRICNAVVVLRGIVLHTPPRADRTGGGVSVRITRYRFVYQHPESELN